MQAEKPPFISVHQLVGVFERLACRQIGIISKYVITHAVSIKFDNSGNYKQ